MPYRRWLHSTESSKENIMSIKINDGEVIETGTMSPDIVRFAISPQAALIEAALERAPSIIGEALDTALESCRKNPDFTEKTANDALVAIPAGDLRVLINLAMFIMHGRIGAIAG